jgi:hypothetical protein
LELVLAAPASSQTIAVTEAVKRLLEGAPDPARLEQALRLLAKWRSELVANTLVKRSGTRVLSGPFKGMDYALRASEGARAARLIGCYEASLVPVIEAIIARDYGLIIDVGSAEGYYAVGLALRMPQVRVRARDADSKAQALCRALAVANGVADRVEVGGLMTHQDFAVCGAQKTLVICDIEGAEAGLLDPALAPGLREADILVETHEAFQPGICETIAARFRASHAVQVIGRRIEDAGLPDWMEGLSDMDRLLALWEWRAGPTPWLWMQRK